MGAAIWQVIMKEREVKSLHKRTEMLRLSTAVLERLKIEPNYAMDCFEASCFYNIHIEEVRKYKAKNFPHAKPRAKVFIHEEVKDYFIKKDRDSFNQM